MKTNKLFFALAAFAAMTFGSCAKDDAGQTGNNDGKDPIVSLRLAFDGKAGRAIEDGHEGSTSTPTVSKVVVEFCNAAGTPLNTFTYTTEADILALQNPGVKLAVNSMATKIVVNANPTSETDINKMQGYDKVHLYGESTITKGTGSGTDADPYKEAVTITPQLARIEVYGAIQPVLGTGNNNSYYAVDVEQIFVNNIHLEEGGALSFSQDLNGTPWTNWYAAYVAGGIKEAMFDTLVTNVGAANAAGLPATGKGEYYTTDHNIGVAKSGAKAQAAGFNIFPQSTTQTGKDNIAGEMPHIILRVKIYKTAEDYAAGKFDADRQFINVRLFNNGTQGQYIKEMAMSNIYRFDLNDLTGFFIDGGDPADPNPEGNKMIIDVKVTVTPWTITSIKPEL